MTPTPSIEFVIFDCDGVLIDSEVLSMQVWIRLLAEYQITIDQQYFFQHFLGRSFQHVQSVLLEDFNLLIDDVLTDRFATELKYTFEQQLKPTEGIVEVLTSLSVPYCLATSSSRPRTKTALQATGLNHYFSEKQIFTASEVQRGKPAPDLFLHAASSLGFKAPHCLVIEDSGPGIQAAKAANMSWLHYIGGSHLQQNAGNNSKALAHWREFSNHFPYLVV